MISGMEKEFWGSNRYFKEYIYMWDCVCVREIITNMYEVIYFMFRMRSKIYLSLVFVNIHYEPHSSIHLGLVVILCAVFQTVRCGTVWMTGAGENNQIHTTHSQDWHTVGEKITKHWSIPHNTQDYNKGTLCVIDTIMTVSEL
jgi:hypothetical protein